MQQLYTEVHVHMSRRSISAAAAVAAVAGLATAITASAHAVQKFGSYTIAIGWQHEPAYAGQLNAVQFFVKDASGDPVSDLSGDALHVQVSAGGVTGTTLNLE